MTRLTSRLRRVRLTEQTRGPAPLDYDYTPRNRKQRRHLARELRKAAKKSGR